LISARTTAAEIDDGRRAALDVVGLPEIRQWFVVCPAAKRPAARESQDFLVAQGWQFLPNAQRHRQSCAKRTQAIAHTAANARLFTQVGASDAVAMPPSTARRCGPRRARTPSLSWAVIYFGTPIMRRYRR
jgi:hypothetical protein